MGIRVTEEAAAVLLRSLELGGLDPDTSGISLRAARGLGGGLDVQVELADGPAAGQSVVDAKGVTLFVDSEVTRAMPDAVVTVEPQHEIVVVRPEEPQTA
jgi:Fe-S cluster assembly iron-binding protein IscA